MFLLFIYHFFVLPITFQGFFWDTNFANLCWHFFFIVSCHHRIINNRAFFVLQVLIKVMMFSLLTSNYWVLCWKTWIKVELFQSWRRRKSVSIYFSQVSDILQPWLYLFSRIRQNLLIKAFSFGWTGSDCLLYTSRCV